mgnify:CR=1 FL=1
MRRCAKVVALELAVALVNHTAIFTVGVPNLRTKVTPAVSADDFRGVNAGTTVGLDASFPELRLHKIELIRRDNCRMAVLHVILRNLTLIDLLLFR